MAKKAILLVNLGTPDSPSTKDVRRYLSEFLNDPFVIDINPIGRALLVNCIIVPFRGPKSAKVYKQLWTPEGSPLMVYGKKVREKLQTKVGEKAKVYLAMRYQNPSMDVVLEEMEKEQFDEVTVIPLFPQYSTACTETIFVKLKKLIANWTHKPHFKYVEQFYDHPLFTDTFVERAKEFNLNEYDHILFSYHGLPKRQLSKLYEGDTVCEDVNCQTEINTNNAKCYQATCYATSRLLAEKLNLREEDYTVTFQSRLGRGWVEPFTDKTAMKLADEGAKRILVFCPAFVADCLETTIEIGVELQEEFEEHGGEKVQLVPSLNEHDMFIDLLENLASN